MYVTVHLPGGNFRPDLEGHGHEIRIKPCRAFNHRCLVDRLAVRAGSVANPNRLRRHDSSRHGRRAETGGKAARVGARSKHNCAASDCLNSSNVSRANAFVCAGFCDGEDCQPGESRQQLQRWLCIKLPKRQRSLGWMQRVGRQHRLRTFLADLPRTPSPTNPTWTASKPGRSWATTETRLTGCAAVWPPATGLRSPISSGQDARVSPSRPPAFWRS
ncbi:hypothetical protein ACVWZK_005018 [Bradyrhizobium sp. GM0.4]